MLFDTKYFLWRTHGRMANSGGGGYKNKNQSYTTEHIKVIETKDKYLLA